MKKYILLKNNLKKNNIFLLKKFPNDVKIFYQNDEYDLDDLTDGKKQVCCIFDDIIRDYY